MDNDINALVMALQKENTDLKQKLDDLSRKYEAMIEENSSVAKTYSNFDGFNKVRAYETDIKK